MTNNSLKDEVQNYLNIKEYIREYCRQKDYGYYDFSLTEKNWKAHYAWGFVLDIIVQDTDDISSWKTELDEALENYCDVIYGLTLDKFLFKIHQARVIPGTNVVWEFADSQWTQKEVEWVEERYRKHFQDIWDFTPDPPDMDIIALGSSLVSKAKKKVNRWNAMNEQVIQDAKAAFEAHTDYDESKPIYLLCVDNNDPEISNRYCLTFKDVVKSGIGNLRNKFVLSKQASNVFYYGGKRK